MVNPLQRFLDILFQQESIVTIAIAWRKHLKTQPPDANY